MHHSLPSLRQNFDIKTDFSGDQWDGVLASLGGHPLQSALWGDARQACDGVYDQRLVVYNKNEIIGLIRLEQRGKGPLKKFLAWVPQGPIIAEGYDWQTIRSTLLEQKKFSSFSLLVTNPWEKLSSPHETLARRTIWIDLKLGKERLWSNLDKQWRYGARRAEKLNVVVETTKEKNKIQAFFNLCQKVSDDKKFKLKGSPAFLHYLLTQNTTADVEGVLFLANHQHSLCAGAFILRVGKTIHYMWGAVDRQYSKERVGEYIQWQIIEWACSQGYHRYDLEGIDEIANPGVASFKKKMGGEVIGLAGKNIYPLNWRGKLAARFIKD